MNLKSAFSEIIHKLKIVNIFRSLRARIFILIFVTGFISCQVVHFAIIETYEGRAVAVRTTEAQTQARILADHLITYGYLQDTSSEIVGAELDMLANLYDGRVMIIDDNLKIIKDTYVKPNDADYKIYILGNAQSMNLNAQNALLKVLEEPPAYAIFILTVTNKASLLETVLSRSVVINLEGVECSAGADYITAHNEDVSYSDAYKALEIWGGNIGKAQDSLNDGKLQKISETADALARGVIADSEYELVKTCSAFVRNNAFLASVLVLTKSIFRDAMFINSDSVSAQRETAELLASRLSRKKLLRLCEACDSLRYMAERNANNPILISKVSSDFRRAVGR